MRGGVQGERSDERPQPAEKMRILDEDQGGLAMWNGFKREKGETVADEYKNPQKFI